MALKTVLNKIIVEPVEAETKTASPVFRNGYFPLQLR